MTKPFDPKQAIKTAKGQEHMLAYAGFDLQMGRDGVDTVLKEGFVKIAASVKPGEGGFLTLTFLIDADDRKQKATLSEFFESITETALAPYFRDNLEKVVRVSLDKVGDIKNWYIEELNIHLRRLKGYEKTIIEKDLFPAIENHLPLTFDPVEWWPQDNSEAILDMTRRMNTGESGVLKNLFKQILG